MVFVDKKTRQRITTQPNVGDIVYPARTENRDPVLEKESKVVVGPWKDYTGSGGVQSRNQLMFGGITNTLAGTDAELNGAKVPNLNEVGQDTSIYRRRQRRVYKKLDGTENHI